MDILALAKINELKKSGGVGYEEKNTLTYHFTEMGVDLFEVGYYFTKVSDEPIDFTGLTKIVVSVGKAAMEDTSFVVAQDGSAIVVNNKLGNMVYAISAAYADALGEIGTWVISGKKGENGVFTMVDEAIFEFAKVHTIDPKFLPTKVINLDSYSGQETNSGEDTSLSACILQSMISNGKSYNVSSDSIANFWRNVDDIENVKFSMTVDTYTLYFKETSRIHTSTDTGEYSSLVSVSLHCILVQDGATIEMRIVIAGGGTSATVVALPTNTPIT